MPDALSGLGAAVIGGQLIIVGGENTTSVFNTVRAYNLTTKAWTNLPNLPQARHGLGVAVIGNTLYAIDGAAQPGHIGIHQHRTNPHRAPSDLRVHLLGAGRRGRIRWWRFSRRVLRC